MHGERAQTSKLRCYRCATSTGNLKLAKYSRPVGGLSASHDMSAISSRSGKALDACCARLDARTRAPVAGGCSSPTGLSDWVGGVRAMLPNPFPQGWGVCRFPARRDVVHSVRPGSSIAHLCCPRRGARGGTVGHYFVKQKAGESSANAVLIQTRRSIPHGQSPLVVEHDRKSTGFAIDCKVI